MKQPRALKMMLKRINVMLVMILKALSVGALLRQLWNLNPKLHSRMHVPLFVLIRVPTNAYSGERASVRWGKCL